MHRRASAHDSARRTISSAGAAMPARSRTAEARPLSTAAADDRKSPCPRPTSEIDAGGEMSNSGPRLRAISVRAERSGDAIRVRGHARDRSAEQRRPDAAVPTTSGSPELDALACSADGMPNHREQWALCRRRAAASIARVSGTISQSCVGVMLVRATEGAGQGGSVRRASAQLSSASCGGRSSCPKAARSTNCPITGLCDELARLDEHVPAEHHELRRPVTSVPS